MNVSADYSVGMRQTRSTKLIEFGKSQGTVFKLRYNKLRATGKTFFYDFVKPTVVEAHKGDSSSI